MTTRVQLGWRVDEDAWSAFEANIGGKDGSAAYPTHLYLDKAMREFLFLVEAERLLRSHSDLPELSSSTCSALQASGHGSDTKKVANRVSSDVKERFENLADEYGVGYGELLCSALESRVNQGLARQLRDDIARLTDDTSGVEAYLGSVENLAEIASGSGSTSALSEGELSTAGGSASTVESVDSSWESDIKSLLEESGFDYEYEPRAFEFDDGHTYTPDFGVGESVIVEVKGRIWKEWDLERARLFMDQFPDYEYIVVGNGDVPCDKHVPWASRDRLPEIIPDGSAEDARGGRHG